MIQPSEHHILHEKWSWAGRDDARNLRNTHALRPDIPRDIHDALHLECPHVPILGSHALRNVASIFTTTHDTFKDMDLLMSCIERASRNPRAHMIERDLAGLAIEAIDLQKPFIREGMLRG